MSRFRLFFQHCVVDAGDTSDGSANKHTLVATIDGTVETLNGRLRQEATKGDTLAVHNVRNQGLDNAKGKRVNHGVVGRGLGAGSWTRVAGGGQVEEVTEQAGDHNAGQGPGKSRRPEAGCQDQEHVGQVNWVVRGADEADGRNGEGVAVGQDLGSDEVELESRDNEEDTGDSAKSLASSVRSLSNARVLVDGRDALAHGDGRAIKGVGDISRSSWQRNASSNLGETAGRRANNSSRGSALVASVAKQWLAQ